MVNFKDSSQLDLLDILSILSFLIGLENLGMNISQEDMQNATEKLDESLRQNVREIHSHLEMQDDKIDEILRRLDNEKDK